MNNLPKEFWSSHNLCFFIHDILLTTLNSGLEQDIFNIHFNLDDEKKNNYENMDIFTFLEKYEMKDERTKLLKTVVLPALLSDSLHCIYESLNSAKKGKLNITFMLIRKPIQEAFYLLESIIYDEKHFGESLAFNPMELRPSTTKKKGNKSGVINHGERIEEVLSKMKLENIFSSSYLSNLRYNKKSNDSFDGICNHAMHLFTQDESIRTENLNINFIFSNEYSRITQWKYFYSRLPYLLLYLYYVVEYILIDISLTDEEYIKSIEVRIFALILLWWDDITDDYICNELSEIVKFAEIKVKEFCLEKNYLEIDKELLEKIADYKVFKE